MRGEAIYKAHTCVLPNHNQLGLPGEKSEAAFWTRPCDVNVTRWWDVWQISGRRRKAKVKLGRDLHERHSERGLGEEESWR
jgi:hypothetical protein